VRSGSSLLQPAVPDALPQRPLRRHPSLSKSSDLPPQDHTLLCMSRGIQTAPPAENGRKRAVSPCSVRLRVCVPSRARATAGVRARETMP